jgi:hypothetical protein
MIRFKPKNFKELAVVCKEIESVLPEDFWNRRRKEKVHEVEQLSEEEESVEQREHVEAIRRPKPVERPAGRPFTCWNCDGEGHNFRNCEQPKKLFCFGCGKKDVTVRKCESCSRKNT